MAKVDAPFKPATTTTLIRDILETYHWEAWTSERLTLEVARIRGVEVTKPLMDTVRSAVRRVVRAGGVELGETVRVRYYDDKSRVTHPRTVKWIDQEEAV